MPVVELAESPLVRGVSPVRIRYRECGRGVPLVFLHGGWGYEIYSLDRQLARLAARHRIIIPDRSGYGGSTRVDRLELDFHDAAAGETVSLIDALGLERPVLWGHSDGAVIAGLVSLAAPERTSGLILEATHLFGRKPASREFFETTARDPDSVGGRAAAVLAHDHGDDWRTVIARHSAAWMRLVDEQPPRADFYRGRLQDLRVPTLLIHGARDPRTEPGELDALRAALAQAQHQVLPNAGHSPHSERASAADITRIAMRFLE